MRPEPRKLREAIRAVKARRPVYTTPLLTLKREYSSSIPVMATDGVTLLWNDELFDKFPLWDLGLILMHECLHKWLGHSARAAGNVDRKLWNAAADLAVNTVLFRQEGAAIPDYFLLPGRGDYVALPHDETAEWYYERLSEGKDDGQSDGEDDSEQPGSEGDDSDADAGDSDDSEVGEDDIRRIAMSADVIPNAEHSRTHQMEEMTSALSDAPWGSRDSYTIRDLLGRMSKPRVDWRGVLRRLLAPSLRRERTFRRESRRSAGGFILPAYTRKDALRKTGIVIDVSGSMHPNAVKALNELGGIVEQYRGIALEVITCDNEVLQEATITSKEDMDDFVENIEVGCLTDMQPGFSLAKQKGVEAIICITDLAFGGRYPAHPGVRVIWVCISGYIPRVPYGRVIPVID